MNNSEIIAIVAIVASALTSIITVLVGYFQNKSNNRAKLSEIAFEKRLEAFRDVYSSAVMLNDETRAYHRAVIALGNELVAYTIGEKTDDSYKETIEEFRKASDDLASVYGDFRSVYYKNRVYLPRNTDSVMEKYVTHHNTSYIAVTGMPITAQSSEDIAALANFCKNDAHAIDDIARNIIAEMHKFVNYQ